MNEVGGRKGACGEWNRFWVTYFPPLSDLLGLSREEASLPCGATLVDMVALLSERHGHALLNLFYKEGAWKPDIGIFIAGRPCRNQHMEIPPSAEIILLPFLVGG